MPCNWREAAGDLVMSGWPASEVAALTGDELMWWFDTLNIAASEAKKRQQKARQQHGT